MTNNTDFEKAKQSLEEMNKVFPDFIEAAKFFMTKFNGKDGYTISPGEHPIINKMFPEHLSQPENPLINPYMYDYLTMEQRKKVLPLIKEFVSYGQELLAINGPFDGKFKIVPIEKAQTQVEYLVPRVCGQTRIYMELHRKRGYTKHQAELAIAYLERERPDKMWLDITPDEMERIVKVAENTPCLVTKSQRKEQEKRRKNNKKPKPIFMT